jgi:hypothetical protein
MHIEVTREQGEELARLVGTALREIGPEIHHTATRDYREYLKSRRQVLEQLSARLSDFAPAGESSETHVAAGLGQES